MVHWRYQDRDWIRCWHVLNDVRDVWKARRDLSSIDELHRNGYVQRWTGTRRPWGSRRTRSLWMGKRTKNNLYKVRATIVESWGEARCGDILSIKSLATGSCEWANKRRPESNHACVFKQNGDFKMAKDAMVKFVEWVYRSIRLGVCGELSVWVKYV